jgi:tight adherence protein B
MTPLLLSAVAGALVVAGLIGLVIGVRKAPPRPPAPPRTYPALARLTRVSARTRWLLLAGLAAGVVVAAVSGWWVAALARPAAAAGLPVLLSAPPASAKIDRLEAMEEWTRALSGVLTVGVGLEQALVSTVRSTPDPIRAEVTTLVSRLRARWVTEDALRAFADDLDDATGDVVAANLILGARRRGAGLASVLEGLAASVAADVRARREIEADRAKPRSTAGWVTIITVSVLSFLALTRQYIAPFGSPLGQVLLTLLLCLYVATLVWMRTMATGRPLPRFIGNGGQFTKTEVVVAENPWVGAP